MNKTPEELEALRGQSIKAIEPALLTLSDADIAALLAAEQAQETPRTTLIADIESEQLRRLENDSDPEQPAATDGGKGGAEGPAPIPEWLRADYTGPLTADQAERRIAVHGHHVTKPVVAPQTK